MEDKDRTHNESIFFFLKYGQILLQSSVQPETWHQQSFFL